MNSSNPVLSRLADRANRHSGLRRQPVPSGPGYATQYAGGFQEPYPSAEGHAPYAETREARMTVDDVVVRTVGLLALLGVTGAASWLLLPESGAVTQAIFIGGGLSALVLGLVISFRQITNPLLISAFAVVEGVVLGLFSRIFADYFGGDIVLQAVVGTFAVFFGMALVYKMRLIRATPTFAKFLIGAMFGLLVLLMANWVLALFGVNDGAGLGLRSGGPLAIGVSLFAIGLAALSFILDFAAVEQGVAMGLPRKYSWYCSFGILVGLVWLYTEILRLLGYMRD